MTYDRLTATVCRDAPWRVSTVRFINRRIGYPALLIVLVMGSLAPGVQAQDGARYDVVLQGVSLEDALRQILTTTDINLAFDQILVEGKRAYCADEQLTAEDLLRCILDGTGLDFYRLSSGLYVLTETAEAQPRFGRLQGIVVDRETGEPLPNAHVLLADGSTGTVSNEAGRFLLANLKPGYHRLTTSYLGYRNRIDSIWVHPDTTAPARLTLDAEPLTVTPIIIDGMQWRLLSDSLGTVALSQQSLLRAPGRSPDVARSLTSLVGIRLSDATADLHVQGGETGEHQFRIDGAPVFIPVSIGGLVGPFSPFAVGRVTVHKSGFGAEVGSQSAGVIQTEHALGQTTPHSFDLQVDPLSVNARLGLQSGSEERTNTAFLFAGRLGLWDVYAPPPVEDLLDDWNRTDPFMLAAFQAIPAETDPATPAPFRRIFSTGDPGVGFLDAHAAGRIRFGPLRSLHFSTYWGRRDLDSDRSPFDTPVTRLNDNTTRTRDRYSWSNSTSQVRYEAVLGPRLLASLRGRASLYRLRHDIVLRPIAEVDQANAAFDARLDPRDDNNNRIQEYAVEARFDVAAQNDWNVAIGVEPTYTLSRFLVQGTPQLPISHQSDGWRIASFINNRFTLSRRLNVDVGSRFTYLAAGQRVFAEPRLAVRYDQPGGLLGPWSMRVATGLYRQFVNQFDVSSRSSRALLASSRMWLGVDSTVSPPHAAHVAGEWLLKPGSGWTFRLEGYYKKHLHLLAVNYAPTDLPRNALAGTDGVEANDLPIPSFDQRVFLADGEGPSYGGAVLVEKKWSRARVEARYEYSQARRSFRPFYNGATIPTPWNEPHRVELALDWQPAGGLTLAGRWRSIWGRTWGFRQAYYDFLGAYRTRLLAAARAEEPLEVTDFAVFSIDDVINHILAYQLQHPQDHTLTPIHQFDVSVAYTHRLAGLNIQTRLDLLNVFDRDNVADWRLAFDQEFYNRSGLLKQEERLLLPFTPSLALRVGW